MLETDDSLENYPIEPLTWREEEILSLLAERQTNREIAQSLNISLDTVKWYNQRLFAKLGVKNRRDAATRAADLGLLDPGYDDTDVPLYNLPVQATPFVGRQQELSQLSAILMDHKQRLITLLAPGGMGKTRLALRLAEQHSSRFSDGIFFVPLNELESEDHLASAIAKGIHLRLQTGVNPRQQLLQHLRQKYCLLILDSFELAMGSVGFIRELLQTAPKLKVLATSRERLKLSGETIYDVYGMGIPDTEFSSEMLEQHSAIDLFVQSARLVNPSFEVRDADQNAVIKICRLVDGMPLGIVLAATWVRILSPTEIAGEIIADLDILSTDMQDIPPRQRSIRAVFTSAWRRLSETARSTFENLAVFQGGFSLDAAQEITKANLPTIQLLTDRGILQRTRSGRFDIHELLRQFALEKLKKSERFKQVSAAHSLYFAGWLNHQEAALGSRHQAATLSRIEVDIENVQQAWRYAISQGNSSTVSMMLPGLYYFYETRGWFEEGEAAFRRATTRFTGESQTYDQALLLGRLFTRQGALAHRQGRYEHAAKALQESYSILRGTGARTELALNLSYMADLSRSLGRYDISRQLCQESLALFKEVNDKWGVAGELHNLGVAAYHLGDFDEARHFYEESLAVSRELDDQHGVVTSLIGIGALEHDLGNYSEAESFYSESLSLSEALGDRFGVAASLINLARVHFLNGDLETGRLRCQAGLDICVELGDRWGMAAALINLGDITCGLGKFEDSRAHFQEAWQIVNELRSEPLLIEIMVGVAELQVELGDNEAAFDLIAPVTPEDKEVKERVAKLRARIETQLSPASLLKARERNEGRSIDDAALELSRLL